MHTRRSRLAMVVAALSVLVAAPLAVGAMVSSALAGVIAGEPTISFAATGTPPLVCGSSPSVSSLTIGSDTRVVVANLTGVDATVDVGNTKVLKLSPGMGARVALTLGQHDLRVIPDCAVLGQTDPVVVNVVPADPDQPGVTPPDGIPDGPSDLPLTVVTTSTDAPPSGSPVPGVGAGATTPGAVLSVAAAPRLGSARPVSDPGDPSGRSEPGSTGGSRQSEVVDVQAIALGDSRDPKGVRLLAVIAAICVFGVTVAVIRAIVAQRTSHPVLR